VIEGERREGDPAVLVADSSLARSELGWQPRFGDLESIVEHAWQWEESRAVKGNQPRIPQGTLSGFAIHLVTRNTRKKSIK